MCLSSGHKRDDLSFDQCEADTIMLSIYAALRSSGYKDPVVIDAEDTDVYIQADAISHYLPGIICIKKKKELLSCKDMCTDEDMAKCLILFHVMTGCNANSCIFRHGKKSLYENLEKSSEIRCFLLKCGESLPLKEDVLCDLKSYVMRYVYSELQTPSLDMARAAKWKRQKKSLLYLPPDDDNLKQHIMQANFLAYIQCHPELRGHPSPIGHGWELVNGCCRRVRHTQPALPTSLADISMPSPPQADSDSDSETQTDLTSFIMNWSFFQKNLTKSKADMYQIFAYTANHVFYFIMIFK